MSKPPLFHIGQAVVVLPTIIAVHVRPDLKLPKIGPVYTVNYVEQHRYPSGRWCWMIGCEEWDQATCMDEAHLAPVELLPAETLAQLLSESLEPVAA